MRPTPTRSWSFARRLDPGFDSAPNVGTRGRRCQHEDAATNIWPHRRFLPHVTHSTAFVAAAQDGQTSFKSGTTREGSVQEVPAEIAEKKSATRFRSTSCAPKYGSGGRTRTYDMVVNSHPLCQLSYAGTQPRIDSDRDAKIGALPGSVKIGGRTSTAVVLFEAIASRRMAKLLQCLLLDLPHPFPGAPDVGAYLLQGHRLMSIESIVHP